MNNEVLLNHQPDAISIPDFFENYIVMVL